MFRAAQETARRSFADGLVDASPDALIALSPDGAVLFWNEGARAMFGYASEEAVGRPVEDLIVPSDLREEARGKRLEALAGHAPAFETTRTRKDGSSLVVRVSLRLVRDEQGCPLFVAVSETDVTTQRQQSATLARFRGVLEGAPDAMVIVGSDGRILIVNSQVEKIFGYRREELVGQSIEILVPEAHRGHHRGHRAEFQAAPAARLMPGRALSGRRKDGSEVAVEISLSPIATPEGTLITAAIRDVTDRRRMEAALGEAHETLERKVTERTAQLSASLDELRVSEARFRTLSTSGLVGIVVADLDGKVHDANDAALRIVGYSRDEMAHTNWAILTPVDRGDVVALLAKEGVAPPRETEMLRKDGALVPVLYGAAMLEPTRFLAFVTDLSDRKRAEQALKTAEEQLRQAHKMEAVGRLAGGVAHDFNNALSVILSYAEMMLGDLKPGDPMRGDVEEISGAGKRAADLTRQLLLFSRQQVVEPKVIDLNEVLASIDKMLQRILGADVDLVSLPEQHLGRVRVDRSSIDQVIMNLVVNARDAMPTGGKLTIETGNVLLDDAYAEAHHGVSPGRYVMLAVSDTGTGIAKADLTRIFEPFFTTKERGKGTGLGLSTVFGIVQQSGGSVWVYSELGQGTTFKIYLPCIDAEVDAVRPSLPPTMLRGSETILLVEDDDHVRAVALGILHKNGYRVLEARNAGEAILHAEKHAGTIHLLLSDVVMPQMSGAELAKRLAPSRPDMRILCMSGYTDDAIVRHGVLDAHFAFLQKPITPVGLARKVREVLGEASA